MSTALVRRRHRGLSSAYRRWNFKEHFRRLALRSERAGAESCPINAPRMELLGRFAVHGIRKILLQHHISKASIFLRSTACIDHDSEPCRKIEKTRARTILIYDRTMCSSCDKNRKINIFGAKNIFIHHFE